jgi:hypothetical protein
MENKTWIVVVLIILVALVAYNFTGMTGEITKDQITKITVSPTKVIFDKYDAGKLVTINVDIGSIGVDNWLQLYKVAGTESIRLAKEKIAACHDNICTKDVTLTYKLTAGLESGTYFFRAERDNYDNIGHDLKFDSNKFVIE